MEKRYENAFHNDIYTFFFALKSVISMQYLEGKILL